MLLIPLLLNLFLHLVEGPLPLLLSALLAVLPTIGAPVSLPQTMLCLLLPLYSAFPRTSVFCPMCQKDSALPASTLPSSRFSVSLNVCTYLRISLKFLSSISLLPSTVWGIGPVCTLLSSIRMVSGKGRVGPLVPIGVMFTDFFFLI